MMPTKLRQLLRCVSGSTIVEFAMIAPAFIVMLLGVLQIGMGLQKYNALRGVSADVARYAMVEKANGRTYSASVIETYAETRGAAAPYLLTGGTLNATATAVTTSRVTGTTELTLNIRYTIPSILSSMGLKGPTIQYTRPIFLTI